MSIFEGIQKVSDEILNEWDNLEEGNLDLIKNASAEVEVSKYFIFDKELNIIRTETFE